MILYIHNFTHLIEKHTVFFFCGNDVKLHKQKFNTHTHANHMHSVHLAPQNGVGHL